MAKRKRAAKLATGSASGFLNSPILQQTQGVGGSALSTIANALGLGGGGVSGQAGFDPDAYLAANPDLGPAYQKFISPNDPDRLSLEKQNGTDLSKITPQQFAQMHYQGFGQKEGRPLGTSAAGGASQGQSALERFMNSLGYQTQLDYGRRAIEGSAAARGSLNSGATLKGLTRYGQGLAQQGFRDYLDQLGGLAEAGQAAARQQASAQQQGQLAASNAFLQPGALGKAAGILTSPLNAAGDTFLGNIFGG